MVNTLGRAEMLRAGPKRFGQKAPLDWLNFPSADVRGGLGPFLAVYLTANCRRAAGVWRRQGMRSMVNCIVIAELIIMPAALLVGHKADRWGRKTLFLLGFAALPLRGLLFALLGSPAALLGIQALDGIGAGIFGALFPIVIADLTRGTGHYNLALGAASASWGLGAALSNGVAGAIADRLGFAAAFLVLTGFALAALLLFALAVPETKRAA